MRKISLSAVCLLALVAVVFVACKKQVETKIEGDWKRVIVADAGADAQEAIWHFKGGKLNIENLSDSTASDDGTYTVVSKNTRNYVRIAGMNSSASGAELNGDWNVVEYKKDILIIAKPDVSHETGQDIGTLVREFTRL